MSGRGRGVRLVCQDVMATYCIFYSYLSIFISGKLKAYKSARSRHCQSEICIVVARLSETSLKAGLESKEKARPGRTPAHRIYSLS